MAPVNLNLRPYNCVYGRSCPPAARLWRVAQSPWPCQCDGMATAATKSRPRRRPDRVHGLSYPPRPYAARRWYSLGSRIRQGQRARDKMASSRRINSLAAHLGLQSTVVALPVAGGGKCRIAICGARPPRCCPSPSPGLSFPLSSSLSPLSLLCLPGAPASLVGGERQAGNAGGWADRGGCTGKTRGGW